MTPWYEKDWSKEIILAEYKFLENKLPKMFGYYLVQLGGSCKKEFLPENLFTNRIVVNPKISDLDKDQKDINCILANYDNLPFKGESIDLVLIMHAFEFSKNPRAILKEIYDSLIFGGHVIIFGFNPIGIANLKKHLVDARLINSWRVKEWLYGLGFNNIECHNYYFKFDKLKFMEKICNNFLSYFGGGYVLIAEKKAIAVTPLRPKSKNIREYLRIKSFAIKPTASS